MGFRAATRAGGNGAVRRSRPLLPLCFAAALAMLWAGAPGAVAAGGAIYVSADQAGALAGLSANFRHRLAAAFYFPLAVAGSERAVMQRVAARPGDIGLAERDFYLRYRREHPKSGGMLEFYGYVPACLVAIVRRGGPIRSFEDLVGRRADGRRSLDIGPAAGAVAASYAQLRRLDAALGNLELEHRGGSLALERVVNGATDAALRFVTPPFIDSELEDLRERGRITLVPFASERIALAAARGKLPYKRQRTEIPGNGWFAGWRSYETTCTELGVVINAHADPSLTEAIAGIVLREALVNGERPWYGPIEDAVVAILDGAGVLARNAVVRVAAWLGWAPGSGPGVALVRDAAGPAAGR